MSTGAFFLLIVQAVVFLVWTVLMFRTLFLLTRRARKDTGQALPGPLASLTQWRYWLTSQEDRRARMKAFAAKTGRTVIVTLGGEGAWAATPDNFVTCPSMKIAPVDTVGAGDTFCGYLAAALSGGLGLETALRQATVAGALACLKPGAQPAIPLRKDVDAALA